MDHIPVSTGSEGKAIIVPYLGLAPPCDGKGMAGYLTRIGIDEEKLVERDFQGHSPEYIDSCLHEWLFFGTLDGFSRICGLWLDRQSLIMQSGERSGSRVVTTRSLPDWTAAIVLKRFYAMAKIDIPDDFTWQTIKEKRSDISELVISPLGPDLVEKARLDIVFGQAGMTRAMDDTETKRVEAQNFLETAWKFIYRGNARHPQQPTRLPSLSIFISINILLESFESIVSRTFGMRTISDNFRRTVWMNNFFKPRVRESGWCPTRTTLRFQGDTTFPYYVSLLPTFDERDHRNCEEYKCVELPSALTKYPALHHKSHCNGSCELYEVVSEELDAILKFPGSPIITLVMSETGKFLFLVHDVTSLTLQ